MPATTPHQTARELACRENDGLVARLLWHPDPDEVSVSVADSRTGDRFQFAVDRRRALHAFHHPFAHA